MRHLGEFGTRELPRDLIPRRGMRVIVRSHRGTELGEVLTEATAKTRKLLGRSDSAGQIMRLVSNTDDDVLDEHRRKAQAVFLEGQLAIKESRLPMQLVDVETLFGGERLIFYYNSESRVDFRELVKDLAKRFKTRIEMRQIGIRDEAKLLADYGDCGKPVCCNTHLDKMPRVSMKMAKLQKASLDPNKISGRCGRLKCCLRYEYDTYEEEQKKLPKPGKWIETDSGIGKVLAQEILAQKVLVAFEDGRRTLVGVEAIVGPATKPEPSSNPRAKEGRPRRDRDSPRPKRSTQGSGGSSNQPSASERSSRPKRSRRHRGRSSGGDTKPVEPQASADGVTTDNGGTAEPGTAGDEVKKSKKRRPRRRGGRRRGGRGSGDGAPGGDKPKT